MSKYGEIVPIDTPIAASRQSAKRHYGVHPYFTRRPYNVVRDYILRYSSEGDRVLDPFGGSGVTAIEAYLSNRTGIQNDINPLANFIASGIARLSEGDVSEYQSGLAILEERCKARLEDLERASENDLVKILPDLSLPPNVPLPSNSDSNFLYDLFDQRQLVALALIRQEIKRIRRPHVREAMLLAFSAALSKLNSTFLSAEGRAASRGGSSIFSIYRYKIAKEPVHLPFWTTFRERVGNVLEAKAEIDRVIEVQKLTGKWKGDFLTYKYDVLELPDRLEEEVDYIFTDPPYGGHIAYLDLSTMWNAWLGISPRADLAKKEIIVGGEREIPESVYVDRLGESIRACLDVLKKDRWMSVVFQHWNVEYFDAILTSASDAGAELKAAVSQIGDPIWSMHKKKSRDSVLAGELILTFYNSGKAKKRREQRTFDLEAEVSTLLNDLAEPIYGELLLNRIVVSAWKSGAIKSLTISKQEFSALLEDLGWHYDNSKHYWLKGQHSELLV